MKLQTVDVEMKYENIVNKNSNVYTKVVLSVSQLTLTDADQSFSSWQT